MYKIEGYYICEKLDIPNFLGIRGDELISVSGCFSGIHPDLTYCYFINDRKNERIEYHEILTEELSESSCGINNFFSGEIDSNELLGYDILGWDISGFHSFLCNSLHKESETLRFNKFCLMENEFETVQDFTKKIQGKGEPVEWIPCRIGKCK